MHCVKVKLCLYMAHSTGIAELVLNLGIRWKLVGFTGQLPYLRGKKLLYLLNRRLGGPEGQSAHCREDKFSCPCQKPNSRSSSPYCHLHNYVFPEWLQFDSYQLNRHVICVLFIKY